MSEPKLSEGWIVEGCCISNGTNRMSWITEDGYDYRVIRRKKKEPMPSIVPGDAVTVRNIGSAVSIHAGPIRWNGSSDWVFAGYTEFGRAVENIEIRNILSIWRDGYKIWERKP